MPVEKVSKIKIAMHQLEASVKLYEQKDFISAITLAGAAEELIGQTVKKLGANNYSDHYVDAVTSVLKKAGKPVPQRKDLLTNGIYKIKNTLKHLCEPAGDPIECDFEQEAHHVFMRVMINIYILGKANPKLLPDLRCNALKTWFEQEKRKAAQDRKSS